MTSPVSVGLKTRIRIRNRGRSRALSAFPPRQIMGLLQNSPISDDPPTHRKGLDVPQVSERMGGGREGEEWQKEKMGKPSPFPFLSPSCLKRAAGYADPEDTRWRDSRGMRERERRKKEMESGLGVTVDFGREIRARRGSVQ